MRSLLSRLPALLAVLSLVMILASCAAYNSPQVAQAPPAPPAPPAPAKIAIDSLDDLPAHSYPLTGTVAELLQDPAQMAALRSQVRTDLESDLATYDITDEATLQGKFGSLLTLSMIDGDEAASLDYLEKIKALEDKEAARLMSGLTIRSMFEAKAATGAGPSDPAFQAAFKEALAGRVNELPWDVVQDRAKSNKGRAEFMTENLMLGIVEARIQPSAEAMGELSADLAGQVIGIGYALEHVLPLNPVIAEVYGDYIEANKKDKVNIWPQREVTLSKDQDLTPVVIAIWDSGMDTEIFGEQMFTNAGERFNGKDDDGNGFVDDVYGIAYDLNGVANPHMLHPVGDQEGNLGLMFESMQGFQDLTAAIDSPEASATRAKLGEMPPAQMGDFLTTLGFGSIYCHGTHVAGIAAAGNPFARLLCARITFDYHTTVEPMTMEIAHRLAQDYKDTAEYFRAHNVRVANMSWGWTFKEIESGLEANGIGQDSEERAAMAREMIGVLSDGLESALASTPEILYVTAAGNDDNDVEFDVVIPSNFDLPNLMVVGAVDEAGDPTSFTSGGRNVKVYSNGFRVESYVPGGGRMKMSGTSMASPNVCNLAAKMLAMDPSLTPVQLIGMIEGGADAHSEAEDILLMNPKKSVAMIK